MTWLLAFLAGSVFGSLMATAAIAMCMMAKEGDRQLDAQQQWREDVRRLLQSE